MSASSRRTIDTDNITLRQIYARGPSNVPIQSTLVLTADGRGGTRWVHPSSLGAYTLNYISTDVSRIQWDLSLNNVFYLTGGQGAGIQSSPTNPYQAIVYAKSYQAFLDQNTQVVMTPFDSAGNLLNSTVRLSTTSWQIFPTLEPNTQTLYFNTNSTMFLVHRVSSLTAKTAFETPYDTVAIDNVNSTIHFVGNRDLLISTMQTGQAGLAFSISTFTSEGYLDLSGGVNAMRSLSTSMPYSYRSTLNLDPNNSLNGLTGLLQMSTPFQGLFSYKQQGSSNEVYYSTIFSTMGWPFVATGLQGSNDIATVVLDLSTFKVQDVTPSNAYLGDAYFSSLRFSLDPFSSIINRNSNASIRVEFSPSFLFQPYQSNVPTSYLTGFSTFLTCGDVIVPTSISETQIYPINANFSNLVQQSLTLNIPYAFARSNYQKPYSVYHYLAGSIQSVRNLTSNWPPFSFAADRSGLSTQLFLNLTGPHNQAHISIIGL
jgi:hypothetical protein